MRGGVLQIYDPSCHIVWETNVCVCWVMADLQERPLGPEHHDMDVDMHIGPMKNYAGAYPDVRLFSPP